MVHNRSAHSLGSSETAAHPDPPFTDGHPTQPTHTRDTRASEDPERPDALHAPSPPGPEANAPPPAEEVTRLRLGAHYAGLVLASMVGCLIRLGLDALGECELALSRDIRHEA
jgi:hypothetical protein